MKRRLMHRAAVLLAAAALAACSATPAPPGEMKASDNKVAVPLPGPLDPGTDDNPYPSTYRPLPAQATAIVHATVLTATGEQIDDGTVVMVDGRIAAVGDASTAVPLGARVIDGRGKWVTPGIIDAHSHLGVYPSPGVASRQDGNEWTNPNTAGVWAEHSIWPQDPAFQRARAGGVTTLLILPGSANLFGGRSVTVKNVPAVTTAAMKFPGAPYSLKMACGENPKRTYGTKGISPMTNMGNVLGYRKGWLDAVRYAHKWDVYRAKLADGESADPPDRDFGLDTLAGVLAGRILVQNHCYRADEMATMLDVADEFGYRITMFHHAVEAYKVAPLLAKRGVCSAIWAERSGTKMEAIDGIGANAALLQRAGACVVIHSDDTTLIQRLNQETAIAMGAGARAGIPVTRAQAIAWITANPARALGIAEQTGTLERSKMADVVLWSGDPFSSYTLAEQVFIDGALVYDRHERRFQPRSDFELGQPGAGEFHP